MRFISTVSTSEDAGAAAAEVIERLRSGLGRDSIDFLSMFTSGHGTAEVRDIAARVGAAFPGALMFGCTGEGTIGDGQEIERSHSVSVLAGELPGVRITPFHVTQEQLEAGDGFLDGLGVDASTNPIFLVVGDPFSVDAMAFLGAMNRAYPGRPIIGGLASGSRRPGGNVLLLDGALHQEGVIGVALTGNIEVDTVVSQGCRPIGRHFIVTKGEGNIVRTLRNVTAMDALKEVASQLTSEEQELVQNGLFLGRAIDEYKSSYGRGDFLIQSVVGADPKTGALAIGGEVKIGTTVQFHVRDSVSADEDLKNLLATKSGDSRPEGSLLFSCNGRGTRMWETPGHDAGVLRDLHEGIPVAGFFCAGELGPVGGQNFVHGFTASVALFRPRD